MKTLTVYSGRDNTIDLLLKEDGVAINATAISRVVLEGVGDSVLDSDELGLGDGGVFDTSLGGGKLRLRLGELNLLPSRYRDVGLIVYSIDNPHGIRWDTLSIEVFV